MERMTKRDPYGKWCVEKRKNDGSGLPDRETIDIHLRPLRYTGTAIDKLAEYENLLERGVNVHLPVDAYAWGDAKKRTV